MSLVADLAMQCSALKEQLAVFQREQLECWCETCRCVYLVQQPGRILQPCPTCKQEMIPTSFNLRLIATLRKERDALLDKNQDRISEISKLYEQIEQLRQANSDLATAAIRPAGMVLAKAANLIAVRNALVDKDVGEAYYQLYTSADWADPYNPFTEWEEA